MTFDAFKDRVFQQARAAGLEEFELYYTDGEKFAVTVFEGDVESTDISKTAGVGFRAKWRGNMGTSFTEALDCLLYTSAPSRPGCLWRRANA